ncbi:MAG TPA: hypothetical protein VMZ27_00910 [Candidatus Saccharimonadales bacterium]|nr:hypothetical protein [Candidatus Saccharimonadales bacterium]
MNSFRLVLCLTGLVAYAVGRHFTSSDVPSGFVGPGQNLTGVPLTIEKVDPASLISNPRAAPIMLKAAPAKNLNEPSEDIVAEDPTSTMAAKPRHLTLNATATLK